MKLIKYVFLALCVACVAAAVFFGSTWQFGTAAMAYAMYAVIGDDDDENKTVKD